MPEFDPWRHRQQPLHLGRNGRRDRQPQPFGGSRQEVHVAGRVAGGQQQQRLCLCREGPYLAYEAPLQPAPDRQRFGYDRAAGQLALGQLRRQLNQGQGIAAGLGHDSGTDGVVERAFGHRGEQVAGGAVGQPRHAHLGQSFQRHAPLAGFTYGEKESDTVRVHAACDEGKDLRRDLIQPLGVIDNHEQGPLGRDASKQREDRQTDHEPVRHGNVGKAERRAERLALWRREVTQRGQERDKQLVHRGETQLHLGLDPGYPRYLHATRPVHRIVQQHGLADPRLPAQDERPAVALARGADQQIERSLLFIAINQVCALLRPDLMFVPGTRYGSPTHLTRMARCDPALRDGLRILRDSIGSPDSYRLE